VPVEIQIPKLGLTMREATVACWLASDGQLVAVGDAVLELTTDKVQTEIVAEGAGILHHAVTAGAVLRVGAVAGWLLAPGEAPPGRPSGPIPRAAAAAQVDPGSPDNALIVPTETGNGKRVLASPHARRIAASMTVDLTTVVGTGPGGRIVGADVQAAAAVSGPTDSADAATASGAASTASEEVRSSYLTVALASPLARRLALRLGVDLGSVGGTGPGGRVTIDDVVAAAAQWRRSPTVPASPGAQTEPTSPRHRAGDRIPLQGMRGIIAERMHASLHEMAQLTLTAEAGADALVELRQRLRREWEPAGLAVPGVTDLVVKAAALALRDHPLLNATLADGEIQLLPDIHLGMAVALEDGLVVPVVRHADFLPLADLAVETARLAAAAREGRLRLDEMEGHTFSVTALGAQGIDAFTPIINAPDVAILGIGRMRDAVRWDGDRPLRAKVMTLSLTVDHRAVDGAPGALFLRSVADNLESPMRLLA
jgi:pyruvate/2-oxoglutarate dehydrogenase complex dihydrolipoamide acyltransferase (E2) component